MARNAVADGDIVQYTNATAAAISSGSVVSINGLLGVALVDLPVGATGSVAIRGVFSVPKVTSAVLAQGARVLWDASAAKFDAASATAAAGDVSGDGAHVHTAAGNGATTVEISFNGVPGTVAT